MFVSINGDKRTGHGRCHRVAGNLLAGDDEASVAEHGRHWAIPGSPTEDAGQARDACPAGAASLLDTAPGGD